MIAEPVKSSPEGVAMSESYPEDSEIGAPRTVHHYYDQKRTGNGDVNRALWLISGALLVGLLAVQAFMWRDQIAFQRDVIDRLARVERRLSAQP